MQLATVFVPAEGLAIAKLNGQRWLDYATEVINWKANWRRVRLPEVHTHRGVLDYPSDVSLAVNAKGELSVAVLYKSSGRIITGKLATNPGWQFVEETPWP